MTAPSELHADRRAASRPGRRFAASAGRPVEVVEDGPSLAGRLTALAATLTIKPILTVGCLVPTVPWPFGMAEMAARLMRPIPGTVRADIDLPHCDAQLVRAAGVLPADGTRRIVLYLHGGAFLSCGVRTHGRVVTMLSRYADTPVLVVNYRMVPKNSVATAVEDCYDAYRWLREHGYRDDQIVLAGDSAGGYLSLALAERLADEGEEPAAMVAMSPFYELAPGPKADHPNAGVDAMFPIRAFEALYTLIGRAARREAAHPPAGRKPQSAEIFEPVEHIEPGLPPTMIHVSGSETLLHDARLAAERLAAAGVPVEMHIWPGQMHVFQLAVPLVPEATRSLRQVGDYIREATG